MKEEQGRKRKQGQKKTERVKGEDVGHLEINISDFTPRGQTSEGAGGSAGQSVRNSENGTYTGSGGQERFKCTCEGAA